MLTLIVLITITWCHWSIQSVPINASIVRQTLKSVMVDLIWSGAAAPPCVLHCWTPWPRLQSSHWSASIHTPASPAGRWILLVSLPRPTTLPPPHSPVLCSQLPGLFLGPRFISTPAGIPSCHSRPPEPLWNAWEWKCTSLMQELILVTFSRQTCTALWCIVVDACGIKITCK